MKGYRVVFFGHRDLRDHKLVEDRLFPLLAELIGKKSFVELYIGRNGEFDTFVASVVKRVQKSVGNENNQMILVLPYPQRDMEYYAEYYDGIIIPDCVHGVHPKGAIEKRNRWMVEEGDLLICYVTRRGGAYNAMRYAARLGKKVINLASDD